MDYKVQEALSEFEKAERVFEEKKRNFQNLQSNCRHNWGETKYTPIVREAYTDPGDRPGTMGVDWRGPTYVPREETPMWTRTCKICGKEDTTTKVNIREVREPRF